jgi:hypothetical protein
MHFRGKKKQIEKIYAEYGAMTNNANPDRVTANYPTVARMARDALAMPTCSKTFF